MVLEFLTAKDVMSLTGLARNQSYKLISDIKSEYDLKTKITKEHLIRYLRLESKDVPKNTD